MNMQTAITIEDAHIIVQVLNDKANECLRTLASITPLTKNTDYGKLGREADMMCAELLENSNRSISLSTTFNYLRESAIREGQSHIKLQGIQWT
jgi:hypothetical protein